MGMSRKQVSQPTWISDRVTNRYRGIRLLVRGIPGGSPCCPIVCSLPENWVHGCCAYTNSVFVVDRFDIVYTANSLGGVSGRNTDSKMLALEQLAAYGPNFVIRSYHWGSAARSQERFR